MAGNSLTHLLERSATSTFTRIQLMTAANIRANLLTDHVSGTASSPMERFTGGPMMYSYTRELVHAPASTPSPVDSKAYRGPADVSYDLRSRSRTHVQQEVSSAPNDEYPYWDRDADIVCNTQRDTDAEVTHPHLLEPTQLCNHDGHTHIDQVPCNTEVTRPTESRREASPMTAPRLSCEAIRSTDVDRDRLDVSHTAGSQADSHCHATTERWRWHMTCDDGTQLTAIQFADDLLVSDIHHPEIQGLIAVLRIAA
jgi:hypothetical protein